MPMGKQYNDEKQILEGIKNSENWAFKKMYERYDQKMKKRFQHDYERVMENYPAIFSSVILKLQKKAQRR